MKRLFTLASLFCLASAHAQGAVKSTWVLDASTVTYRLTHPVHEVEGTSHQSRGKGICQSMRCEFLIATPVKTFDSGDTNRDLHMLQTVRGAEFPFVTVRFGIPQTAAGEAAFATDVEVTFAGQTAHYSGVRFTQAIRGEEHTVSGVIPATIKDSKIDPPRFLTVPIHNEIPVRIEGQWHEVREH